MEWLAGLVAELSPLLMTGVIFFCVRDLIAAVAERIRKSAKGGLEASFGDSFRISAYFENVLHENERRLLDGQDVDVEAVRAEAAPAALAAALDENRPPTERLLALEDGCRKRLIELTGAEGKGRKASLQKLALLALKQEKISTGQADALVDLNEFANRVRSGDFPESTAEAIVTVSGTLLN
jgi:hypothetical protein